MTETDEKSHHSAISFDDSAVQQCPFPAYDMLRENEPVYIDSATGNYILTRYEHVRKALLDHKMFYNRTGLVENRESEATQIANAIFAAEGYLPIDTLVSNNPPSHKRYRSLVDKAFIASRVLAIEPRIVEICDALIDQIGDKDEIDFVVDFAMKLPLTVISEQMGAPTEDIALFKKWSDDTVEQSSPVISAEREIEITHSLVGMQKYFAATVERYRVEPDESKLISRLVHADIEAPLDMRELVNVIQTVMVGGNETTTAALAAGMKLLIYNPALVGMLRASPDKMESFVEETLRLFAPVQSLFRRKTSKTEIGGVEIPQGAIVEVRYGAANRDPERFDAPACPNLERANSKTHLTFGAGVHNCVGNQLARSEMRIAFSRFVERFDKFRLTRGEASCTKTNQYILRPYQPLDQLRSLR